MEIGGVLRRLITEQQFDICFIYRKLLANAAAETYIPVENIRGPILLISAAQDAIWPSEFSGRKIMERLDAHRFPHAHRHLVYEKASHLLVPFSLAEAKAFQVERKYPRECEESRLAAYEKTLTFLQNW